MRCLARKCRRKAFGQRALCAQCLREREDAQKEL